MDRPLLTTSLHLHQHALAACNQCSSFQTIKTKVLQEAIVATVQFFAHKFPIAAGKLPIALSWGFSAGDSALTPDCSDYQSWQLARRTG
jgi:hypothetical protein